MKLTDKNFNVYAAHYYDNPGCVDEEEFRSDLDRFKHIKRAFRRYENGRGLNTRWVLNQILILYNVFDSRACTLMMIEKFSANLSVLKPFLIYLERWPEEECSVPINQDVVNDLRELDRCST